MSSRAKRLSRSRRLWLFIRDYCSEFGIAWSLARNNDCERIGGHFWGEPAEDEVLGGLWRVCSNCGCSQSVQETNMTATSDTIMFHSNTTGGSR